MSVLEILGVWPLLKVFFKGIASVNWGDGGFIYGTLSVLTVHFGGCCRFLELRIGAEYTKQVKAV